MMYEEDLDYNVEVFEISLNEEVEEFDVEFIEE